MSYTRVREQLSKPGFYPHRPSDVTIRESHSSCVFLAGDLAYKLKKPLRFDFLDYSDKATRRRLCGVEVRLNRRLAPALYLGVRAVVETEDGRLDLGEEDDPRAVDYLVEMRRFDERRTLASLVERGVAGAEEIRAVGRLLARFHAAAEPAPAVDPRDAIRRATGETFASLHRLAPEAVARELLAAEELTAAYLVSHRGMLLERAAAGLVRDGHGDLRAEHVVLEDPIAIIDCLEFDPALRQIDVAEDLAFLTMDLTRLGAPELAFELVASYRDAGGDPGEPGLLSFHAAQRAWVRAKVELLSGREVQARAYLRLGRRFGWQARRPLVLVVCGASGSGKSHLAAALAQVSGSVVVSSDAVRKELAGIEPAETARREHYSASFSRRTYRRLGELAAEELERSGLVIVDATFRRRSERAQFAAGTGALAARVAFVECLAPRELRLDRIRRRRARGRDASDVTVELARRQRFAPLTEVQAHHHLPLRTDRDTEGGVHAVEAWLNEIRISPSTDS